MANQEIRREIDAEKPAQKQVPLEERRQKNAAGNADGSSLLEALQALVQEMSKFETEIQLEQGIKKLGMLRNSYLSAETGGDAAAMRRNAQALIDWVEARMEQLRRELIQKRRAYELELLKKLEQEEKLAPSLLPDGLVDAVVHSTAAKDPEAEHSEAPEPQAVAPELKKAPETPEEKKEAEPEAKKEEKPAEKATPGPVEPAPPEKTPAPAKVLSPAEPAPKEALPTEKQAAQAEPKKPEWSKYERLVAHMTASVREDPRYFDQLRKKARRKGPQQPAPADAQKAEAYQKAVRSMGMRLVNMEMQIKAASGLEDPGERAPLMRSAARELKLFMREFRDNKQALPEMAGEYDRLFGGWVHQFAVMQPEKGQELLVKKPEGREARRFEARKEPKEERRAEPKAKAKAEPKAEQEAPVLVLRRREEWEQ